MCLEIIAQIPKDSKNRVGAKRLSKLTGLHVSKIRYGDGPALHFSATGGCSCDFLGDNAEFDAPVWNLKSLHLPALADAVKIIGKEAKRFFFLAHWLDGESIKGKYKTKLKELINDIHENNIKNNILYVIE